MKRYITIDQEFCVENNLTLQEIMILNWFIDFRNTDRMTKLITPNGDFYWVAYQKVINDLPILQIKDKKRIRAIFDTLVEKEFLEKTLVENHLVGFREGKKFINVIAKNGQVETTNSKGGDTNGSGGSPSEVRGDDHFGSPIDSYNSNVNIDSYNKINMSCLNSKEESNTNKTEINLSLNNQNKEVKDIDTNKRYASSKAKVDNKEDINKIREKSFISRGDYLRLAEQFGNAVAGVVLKWAKENIKNTENYDIECLEYVIKKLRGKYIDKYEEFDENGFVGFVLKSLKQGIYFYEINEGEFYDNYEKNSEKNLTSDNNDDIINYMIDEIMKDERIKSKMIGDLSELKPKPDEHWERALNNIKKGETEC